MDFADAIAAVNTLLLQRRPSTFDDTWIVRYRPDVHRFVVTHVRTELGDVDWDAVVSKLQTHLQRKWRPKRRTVKRYRNAREVQTLLRRYTAKRYVFLVAVDAEDVRLRDVMIVRLAQRGNVTAAETVREFMEDLAAQWVEERASLRRWQGHRQECRGQIEGCVRRYRFTGSFVGYVYMTLLYAARGLPPPPLSLDQPLFDSAATRLDRVVQDPETGDAVLFRRSGA